MYKRNSIDSKKSTAGYSSGLDWECLISDVHVSIDFYSIPKEEGEYIYLFSEIWLVKKYERVYLGISKFSYHLDMYFCKA